MLRYGWLVSARQNQEGDHGEGNANPNPQWLARPGVLVGDETVAVRTELRLLEDGLAAVWARHSLGPLVPLVIIPVGVVGVIPLGQLGPLVAIGIDVTVRVVLVLTLELAPRCPRHGAHDRIASDDVQRATVRVSRGTKMIPHDPGKIP